jgi:VanZ family protein
VDKLLHLLGHAGFTAALIAALDGKRPTRVAILAVIGSTGYGIGTELLQEVVPGREFEPGDVLAGFLGSLTGVVLWRFVAARREIPGGDAAQKPEGPRGKPTTGPRLRTRSLQSRLP